MARWIVSIPLRRSTGGAGRFPVWRLILSLFAMGFFIDCGFAQVDDFERDPINYTIAPTDNPISRLQKRLDEGSRQLEHDGRRGYLKSLLTSLEIPVSSQTLVFSKTSLQRDRITPQTPRAIYFNDDVSIGFCQYGDVLEVSAADPDLGAVFYTLNQASTDKPVFRRQNDKCLVCHATSNTRGVPGHLVRSVYVDQLGLPVFSMGTHRIDHSSPLEKRWGGWYVTGTHGDQNHLGNLILSNTQEANAQRREPVDNAAGQNVMTLDGRIDTSAYLSSGSDLVALMVLEHQTEAYNLLTRANFQTRQALFAETRLNKDLGEAEGHRWASTTTRINSACEALVKYLLFCDEAALTAKVQGTTSYADEFSKRGPRDPRGRSLREFDLESRLFRYPCSYLIYSRSFDALPNEAKDVVYRRLWEILSGQDRRREFSHLSDADRATILEILIATKPGMSEHR